MNISTNKTLSVILAPVIKFCEYLGNHHPVLLVKIRYFAKFKKMPNLKNPQDLNEKILWLKLFSDTTKWTELADKYKVREYVEGLGLGKYLVKLYGHWTDVKDINFNELPNSLIFKVNNGDGKGTNYIVRDLKKEDKRDLCILFEKWLNRKNIGALSAEPQYKNMIPCIIAEELLPIPNGYSSLVDYKIWCINGEAKYIWTCCDRDEDGGGADVMTYDLDWNPHPEFSVFTSEYRKGRILPKPDNLDEMLDLAEKLSNGFPQLRVDLYNINGKIYFGELTFTSQGGMMDFYTKDFLTELGKDIKLPNRK